MYSRGQHPFYPIPSAGVIQLFSGSNCGCLAAFPRNKSRTNSSLFFLLDNFGWRYFKSLCSLRTMKYDYSWAMQLAESFYLAVFVFLSQGLLDHSFVNHCRSGLFLYITDLSVSKQSNSFELETLEAKCNLLNNFLTKKDLPPHRHLRIVANSLFIYSWQRLLFSSIGYT